MISTILFVFDKSIYKMVVVRITAQAQRKTSNLKLLKFIHVLNVYGKVNQSKLAHLYSINMATNLKFVKILIQR